MVSMPRALKIGLVCPYEYAWVSSFFVYNLVKLMARTAFF